MTIRELLVKLGVKADAGPVRKFDRALTVAKTTMVAAAGVSRSLTTSILGLAAGYLSLQAGVGAVKELVSSNVEFENLNARLMQVTGSAEKANASMAWIQNFAATTPFSIQQVTQAYTDLLKRGIEPTSDGMKALGDVAAANQSSVDLLIQGIRGLVTSGNTEVLETATGLDVAVKGAKVTVAMLDGSKKTIDRTFASLVSFYTELGKGGQYAGGMERLSKTLDGRFSNLKDTLWQLSVAVGKGGLSEAIRDVTTTFTGAIGEGEHFAKAVGAWLGDMVRNGAGLLKQVLQLLPTIIAFVGQLSELGRGIAARVLPLVLGVLERLAPVVLGALQTLWSALAPLLDTIAGAVKSLLGPLGSVLEKVLPVVASVIASIASILNGIVGKLLPPIQKAIEKGAPLLVQAASKLLPLLAELIGLVVDLLAPLVVQLIELFSAQFREIAPLLVDTVAMVLTLLAELVRMLKPFITLLGNNGKVFASMTTVFLKTALLVVQIIVKILGAFLPPLLRVLGIVAETINKVFSRLGKVGFPMLDGLLAILEPIATLIGYIVDGIAKIADFALGSALNPLGPVGEALGIPGVDDILDTSRGDSGQWITHRLGEMLKRPGQLAEQVVSSAVEGGRSAPAYNVSGVNVHIAGSANMNDTKVRAAMNDAGKEIAKGLYVEMDGWKSERDDDMRKTLMQIETSFAEK